MKKILINGANSYIGTSFEKYINAFDGYEVDTVDMLDGSWRDKDFSQYDVVFHVAGIAHIKETRENAEMYYKVNRDLAIEVAKKAKNQGVTQFVLLSSMSVYGMTTGIITKDTVPKPVTNYGKSKLEADLFIEQLNDDSFKVAILRPPMVYGEGCKGNYQLLKKLALITPVFPDIHNKRSMLNINLLCEFVKGIIDSQRSGYYYPQDKEYVCTSKMVFDIAAKNRKRIIPIKLLNPVIRRLKTRLINKIFGDLIYLDME